MVRSPNREPGNRARHGAVLGGIGMLGALVGAGLTFLLDPDHRPRRSG